MKYLTLEKVYKTTRVERMRASKDVSDRGWYMYDKQKERGTENPGEMKRAEGN
jgi:hypothetical protein